MTFVTEKQVVKWVKCIFRAQRVRIQCLIFIITILRDSIEVDRRSEVTGARAGEEVVRVLLLHPLHVS